jgi:hypothetical protein
MPPMDRQCLPQCARAGGCRGFTRSGLRGGRTQDARSKGNGSAAHLLARKFGRSFTALCGRARYEASGKGCEGKGGLEWRFCRVLRWRLGSHGMLTRANKLEVVCGTVGSVGLEVRSPVRTCFNGAANGHTAPTASAAGATAPNLHGSAGCLIVGSCHKRNRSLTLALIGHRTVVTINYAGGQQAPTRVRRMYVAAILEAPRECPILGRVRANERTRPCLVPWGRRVRVSCSVTGVERAVE